MRVQLGYGRNRFLRKIPPTILRRKNWSALERENSRSLEEESRIILLSTRQGRLNQNTTRC